MCNVCCFMLSVCAFLYKISLKSNQCMISITCTAAIRFLLVIGMKQMVHTNAIQSHGKMTGYISWLMFCYLHLVWRRNEPLHQQATDRDYSSTQAGSGKGSGCKLGIFIMGFIR